MEELYWEAKAYDKDGNLVMVVHNVEVAERIEAIAKSKKKTQKPAVELVTKNSLFDMAIAEGLTEEALKIIWGVMPGDMRLKKPLTAEEQRAEREAFKLMLKEARDRMYWDHKAEDEVVTRHNDKLRAGKGKGTGTKAAKGAKKEKGGEKVEVNWVEVMGGVL